MSPLKTAILVLTLLLMTAAADAHPFHASTTEIEWNSESQRFEVAMRLRIADLEDAISARIKSRFRLETDPKRKMHLQAYLRETFSITFAKHQECRLHWVGYELELHDAWVYFEAESVASTDTEAAVQTVRAAPTRKIKNWDGLFRESASSSVQQRSIRIQNVALLEIQREQINLVSLSMASSRLTTSFHQQKRDKEILEVP